METRSFLLDSSGGKIPCRAFLPEGEAELAVLGVHGFAGDKESSVLYKLAEALCLRRGALVCFDFPAHGESRAPDSHLRVHRCMEDFLTVADHIRQQFPGCRYGVFATSFGGYITLLCAERIPDFGMVLRAPAVTMAETFIRRIINTHANVLLVPFPGADHRFKGPGETEKIVNTAMRWLENGRESGR